MASHKYRVIGTRKKLSDDVCIRCGSRMVHIGFKIYRCERCGHEEKPEDL